MQQTLRYRTLNEESTADTLACAPLEKTNVVKQRA